MTDQPTTPETPHVADDGGAALERSAEAIREAKDAEGTVASHDDITTQDDAREGERSEDPAAL